MSQDKRTFSLTVDAGPGPIYDKHKTWTVLEALEAAANAGSTQYETAAITEAVSVTHATGDYTRTSVREAKSVAEMNDYYPCSIGITFAREGDQVLSPWVKIHTWDAYWGRNCTVEVLKGTEVEVTGVYALLKSAGDAVVRQVTGASSTSGTSAALEAGGTWYPKVVATLLSHPLVATVLGGLTVAAVTAYFGIR